MAYQGTCEKIKRVVYCDSFENTVVHTRSPTYSSTFTGREYDPESGLYYYRARYYDPGIGRFLQPDPLDMATVILIRQYFPDDFNSDLLFQHALRNPEGVINVYSYIANSPINWIDPYGLWKIDPVVGKIGQGLIGAGIGIALELAIRNLEPGILRGSLLIIQGTINIYAGIQLTGGAILIGIASVANPFDPVTAVIGLPLAYITSGLAGAEIGIGLAQMKLGYEEIKVFGEKKKCSISN